jgi:hypothetical protein
MTDSRSHTAYLPVTTFGNAELKPLGGDGLAFAYRWMPIPDSWRLHKFCLRGQGGTIFELDALTQLLQGLLIRPMLNLNPVGFLQFETRVGNQLLQLAIVSQQNQTFTVPVQPPSRIHVLNIDIVFQGLPAGAVSELCQHIERFIKQDQLTHIRSVAGFNDKMPPF